jgi:DNA-directed RNA polymerase specialized sigma24 family protein
MSVTEELIERARHHDPDAARALLADRYPSVRRIALALTGSERTADEVVHGVLERSLRVMPTWRRGAGPENWFYHHKLFTARDVAGRQGPPDLANDPLVAHGPTNDPGYQAFIRALRGLPPQQAEAYLLHHGERLNERHLGVAMDCSANAAAEHLRAAGESLAQLIGPDLDGHTAHLTQGYARLAPVADAAEIQAGVHVQRLIRRRKWRTIRKVVLALLVAALLAGAYLVWRRMRE